MLGLAMKIFLIAGAVVLAGDVVINHGAGTSAIGHAITGFFAWITQTSTDSIFTR